ncbi:MAG: ATP-binding protein, partial [Acidimicrobiia bacterium]|nr:ATP-binding protein [Acidimicrobiia bacterium]
MDWYVDSADHEALSELRHEFGDYLRRHADDGGDIEGSQLVFAELVNNAAEHAGGPMWISVDWGGEHPVLTVWDLGGEFDGSNLAMPDGSAERGRGLAIASALAGELELAARRGGGTRTQA